MKRGHCILVFGVSGVGKTSACEDFVRSHPNFLYGRSSVFLQSAKKSNGENLRTADAEEIRANQSLLGERLRTFRDRRWERPLLIDAHAVIDNDRELVEVPCAAVASMQPNGIILLEAASEIVAERRRSDPRQRPKRSPDQIDSELIAERNAVLKFARMLNLPLEIDEVIDAYRLDHVVQKLVQRMCGHFLKQ